MTLLVDLALIGSVLIVLADAIDEMELVFIVPYVGPYSAMSAKLASGSFSIPTYLNVYGQIALPSQTAYGRTLKRERFADPGSLDM